MLDMRHKVECNFIRVTRRFVPGMIQRCTGTLGRHGDTRMQDVVAKAIIEKDIVCGYSAIFFWMLCYIFMNIVDVLINNPIITS